ncbi:nucleopolyhedrovirus P10 family protein [Streptomyces poonensis]|uniref:Nucleopolyhedrovirus P10 family protein n=1 Tax=Streptomyces poonensis TaxID=68255 RepID=A0A918Q6X7_9ACTN|nr:nucleopolyhedrovirus P10 family protein [Streptomyces poonensis]GGZ34209.1 hypothetical protein GCM10010365_63880 [Streptomyces poonensis]GLJ89270.1 hypothetical protein GCM10017589_18700 [Streptomyces poonensis]
MTADDPAAAERRAAFPDRDRPTAEDRRAVHRQLALGRVLPLGGPRDGTWITERAARPALHDAAASVRGVRPGRLRISPARPDESYDPAVPPPPSALPPGPLRIDVEFRVSADPLAAAAEPLPVTAGRLREVLARSATERLGLTVTEVDLRVTGLLDAEEPPAPAPPPEEPSAGFPGERKQSPGNDEEARVAAAVLAVPGVTRLTGVLGGLGRAIHIGAPGRTAPSGTGTGTSTGTGSGRGSGPALPRRHVRVEIAVAASRRTLDVARAVRAAAGGALPDHPSVAVLVTAVDRAEKD